MRFIPLNSAANYHVGKLTIHQVLTSELCSELLKVVWYVEVKVVFPYVQWFTHSLVVVLEHPRVSTDLV